jgi:hypothetical protein
MDGFDGEVATQKSTFHETKEVVSRLREQYKFKIKAYKTQKESGHILEFDGNLSADEIDSMLDKDGPIVQGIKNCIAIIEGPMQSKYLGMVKDEAQ